MSSTSGTGKEQSRLGLETFREQQERAKKGTPAAVTVDQQEEHEELAITSTSTRRISPRGLRMFFMTR